MWDKVFFEESHELKGWVKKKKQAKLRMYQRAKNCSQKQA